MTGAKTAAPGILLAPPPHPNLLVRQHDERALEGVVSFDIGQDLTDPNSLIATVFEDRDALDRQEAQAEVARVMELLDESLLAEPEATVLHVSSSEPHTG